MTGDQRPAAIPRQLTERLDIDFALQATGLGVWELDPATNQVIWDDRCRQLFGLATDNQLPYEQAIQYIHAEDRDRVDQAVKKAQDPGSDGVYEQTYRTIGADDGQLRWVRFQGRSYFSPTGELARFAGIAQEVTQPVLARQREDTVRQEAQRQQRIYEAITASTSDLMCVFDLNYRFTYANQALLAMWGKSWENSIGKSLLENGYEPWHAQMHEREIDQVVATRQSVRGEVSVPHATLGQRIYDYVFAPVLNEQGEVEAIAGTARDITDSRQAQDRSEQSEARFRSLIEEAPVATCLFVGRELRIEVANAPMIGFWGKGTSVLGQPLKQALPELEGQPFLAILDQVFTTGQTYTSQGMRADLVVDGVLGTYYFDFIYKPLRNSAGEVYAIMEMATDVTNQVQATQLREESQRQLLDLFEQSPVALATISADDELVFQWANTFYGELVARSPQDLMGKPLLEALPEINGQGFDDVLKNVIVTGIPFHAPEVAVDILRNGQLTTMYVDLSYQIRKGMQGEVAGILVVATDVTTQVLNRKEIEESEARFRSIVEQAPVAINTTKGPTHVIELANERMVAIWGREPQTVQNKALFDALPEAAGQGFEPLFDHVYNTGETYRANEVAVTLLRQGVLETIYVDFVIEPFREHGTIVGLIQVAIDVTEQVLARREKAELEARMHTIITNLPSATVVFRGRNLVVESPSKNFIDIIDRGPDVAGKPLGELMPELESQSFLAILDNVYTSGQPFRAFGTPVDIRQADGSVTRDFFDLIYTPLLDSQGQSYAILSVATNVTDVIKAHQQLQESEALFRTLADSIDQLAWIADATGWIYWYNQRWYDYTGTTLAQMQGWGWKMVHHPDYIDRVVAFVSQAWGRDEPWELTFPLRDSAGNYRWFLTRAYPVRDATGQVRQWVGTNTDIDEQKQAEADLEAQVQVRTSQLETSMLDLRRSNDNLQTFAYVASHDLQEPLRKIQQFGDLLTSRYIDSVGEELVYVERMQSAARRMSTLIKDLLDFSRISTQRDVSGPVSLQTVVEGVLSTLELQVEELGAQIQVGPLPAVSGDASQLGQLFQNLLSNALKFHRTDQVGVPVAPVIAVDASLMAADQLPPGIKPGRVSTVYHQLTVADNGIGFDEKYLDRIFQVFQRLHRKSEFAGTGIGLAICEKVVANHGGAITATSQPGQGSTFTIYLPA